MESSCFNQNMESQSACFSVVLFLFVFVALRPMSTAMVIAGW